METQLSNADAGFVQLPLNLSGEEDTEVNGSTDSDKPLGVEFVVNTEVNGSTDVSDKPLPLGVEFVEKVLNYEFKDKSLLLQAFTDVSYDEEDCDSYERLEFLGDTVLSMAISNELFNRYPDCPPGPLTKLRAVNVDTEKLARAAIKHKLYLCLRHKKPLLDDQILEFEKEIEAYPLHSRGLLGVPKSLADIVESTIGAIYKDCVPSSIETVWKVVKPLLEPIITLDKMENHPVSELLELCQKKNLKWRFEDRWEDEKDVLLFIEVHLVGRGHHPLKKDRAKNFAAKNAIENFSNFFPEEL